MTAQTTFSSVGSHVETQYELLAFGIPSKNLPVNSEGVLRLKDHHKFLKTRQRLEQEGIKSIVVPKHQDILMGRGCVITNHRGNQILGNYIEDNMEEYYSAKRAGKQKLVKTIVDKIVSSGGSFLRQDKDGRWEEVDEKTALDKVGHGFRNRKPPHLNKKAPAEKRRVEHTAAPVAKKELRQEDPLPAITQSAAAVTPTASSPMFMPNLLVRTPVPLQLTLGSTGGIHSRATTPALHTPPAKENPNEFVDPLDEMAAQLQDANVEDSGTGRNSSQALDLDEELEEIDMSFNDSGLMDMPVSKDIFS